MGSPTGSFRSAALKTWLVNKQKAFPEWAGRGGDKQKRWEREWGGRRQAETPVDSTGTESE